MRYTAGLTTKIAGKTRTCRFPYPRGRVIRPGRVKSGWRSGGNCAMELSVDDWYVEVMPALAAGCSIVIKPSETTH